MGDSKSLDFTESEWHFESRFSKNHGKKWDKIPTFHIIDVDKNREVLINANHFKVEENYE